MKRPDTRGHLHDIVEACQFIRRIAAQKTLEEYLADPVIRKAVEREFITIGEALAQATRLDPALHQRITDAPGIIAFRNRPVHGYASVADDIVWAVIRTDLPALHAEVAALLEEADDRAYAPGQPGRESLNPRRGV